MLTHRWCHFGSSLIYKSHNLGLGTHSGLILQMPQKFDVNWNIRSQTTSSSLLPLPLPYCRPLPQPYLNFCVMNIEMAKREDIEWQREGDVTSKRTNEASESTRSHRPTNWLTKRGKHFKTKRMRPKDATGSPHLIAFIRMADDLTRLFFLSKNLHSHRKFTHKLLPKNYTLHIHSHRRVDFLSSY